MKEFKARASYAGKLMTAPRNKSSFIRNHQELHKRMAN